MNIEKVTSVRTQQQLPGLVDILLGVNTDCYHESFVVNIASVFGNTIISKLHKLNINVGGRYGSEGVDIMTLMATPVDPDTVYEICAHTYASLTSGQRRSLRAHHIIVHDLMEGGYLLKDIDTADVQILTGSADSFPVYLLATVANSIKTGNICSVFPDSTEKRLAIIPTHKPRPTRLNMLHAIDESGLLSQCEWSLWFNQGVDGEPGSFTSSPNVGAGRWTDAGRHPFVTKYGHLLPKQLDYIDNFADCLPMHSQYHGKFKWHVVCETYMDRYFTTEKTFKAFIAGHIPLTVAKPGFNSILESMGFRLPGNYDHLPPQERIQKIVEILKQDNTDYTDIAQHNYNLITSVESVSDIMVNKIVEMALTRQ